MKYTPPTHQLISHEDFIAREVEFALCRKFWRAYFSTELRKIDATYSKHGPSYVLNEQLELRKEVPFQINPESRLVFRAAVLSKAADEAVARIRRADILSGNIVLRNR